jgi:alkylated DNA repair dioxygenase AlkB
MQRFELGAGAFVDFEPRFFEEREADRYLAELLARVSWEQGKIVLFGREILEPRLTAWIGDLDYTYSGRTLRARPWPPILGELRAKVESAAEQSFNSVFLNRYRSGRDSMGYHSDAEPELGENPVIASLSFGASRRFVLKPKRQAKSGRAFELSLGHGSLLVMGGSCQHTFRHAVPKQLAVGDERLNLTFRRIYP